VEPLLARGTVAARLALEVEVRPALTSTLTRWIVPVNAHIDHRLDSGPRWVAGAATARLMSPDCRSPSGRSVDRPAVPARAAWIAGDLPLVFPVYLKASVPSSLSVTVSWLLAIA
jgi:hypothetical protein